VIAVSSAVLSARLFLVSVGVGLAAAAGDAAPAEAQRKPAVVRACNVSAIPLVVGNEWTYTPVEPPEDRALSDSQKKLTPVRPEKIVIKVSSIETQGGVTTVTLREDIDGKAHDTTITCTAGGARFQISMEAFWFAGEPGRSWGIELSEMERKGQSLALAGGKLNAAVPDWHDDIKAKWKHVPTAQAKPTMRSGTLDLVRHWVQLKDEPIATTLGAWTTKQFGLETQPTLTIEPPTEQPLRLPNMLVNVFWIADGVGPVQILNSYGVMFQLTAANLQK
jgi:hypothetical protein